MKPEDLKAKLEVAKFLFIIELGSLAGLGMTPKTDLYYVVCWVFNFMAVLGLPIFIKQKISLDFQILNTIVMVIQYLGFLGYWFGWPVQFYNVAIHVSTAVQFIRLVITRKGDSDGFFEDSYWNAFIHSPVARGCKFLYKKEA